MHVQAQNNRSQQQGSNQKLLSPINFTNLLQPGNMIVETDMEYSLGEKTDAESCSSLNSTKLEKMFEEFVRDFKMQKAASK